MDLLPTVDLCGKRITRLICGGNLVSGHSHVSADMDDEMTTLEAKLAKARMIKQGMMQELLTGRIRLV